MVSKYFITLLVYKTKFSNPCHALKNSVAKKGLRSDCKFAVSVSDWMTLYSISNRQQTNVLEINTHVLKT